MAAISNALDLNKLNFMNNTGYIVNSENGIFYFLFCSLIYLTEKQVLCPCYMKKHHSIDKYFNTLLIFMSRSEEHTSELQSRGHLVCRLLLEKKKIQKIRPHKLKKDT